MIAYRERRLPDGMFGFDEFIVGSSARSRDGVLRWHGHYADHRLLLVEWKGSVAPSARCARPYPQAA
jgi:hypothetical protein